MARQPKPTLVGDAPEIGHNSAISDLQDFVDRIERLTSEIEDLSEDRKVIFAEAKAGGFDLKVLRIVLRRRRRKASELSEEEQLIELYEQNLNPA